MDMIERVARALYANDVCWEVERESVKDEYRTDARAAIEAMRINGDRNIAMEQAGGTTLRAIIKGNDRYYTVEAACAVYEAMIDAALKGGKDNG